MTTTASKTVLYAEDDENDVFFMERAFSKLKLRGALHVVTNGRDAVDYLAGVGAFADRMKHPLPDLLLLDVKMPRMSGLEVLTWARAQPEFHALPILLFTSSTQRTDIETSRAQRANGYLVKPSNADQLAVFVRRILDAAATPGVGGNILDLAENQLRGG